MVSQYLLADRQESMKHFVCTFVNVFSKLFLYMFYIPVVRWKCVLVEISSSDLLNDSKASFEVGLKLQQISSRSWRSYLFFVC